MGVVGHEVLKETQVPSGHRNGWAEGHARGALHSITSRTQVLSLHCTGVEAGHVCKVGHWSRLRRQVPSGHRTPSLHPTTRLADPHLSVEAAQAPFSHSTHPMGHVTAEGQSWNRSRHSPLGHFTCPKRHEKVSVHLDASGLQVSSGHKKPPLAQVRSVEQSSRRATHAPLRHWNWNKGSVHALEGVTGGQSLGSLTQLRPSGHTDVKGGQARLYTAPGGCEPCGYSDACHGSWTGRCACCAIDEPP